MAFFDVTFGINSRKAYPLRKQAVSHLIQQLQTNPPTKDNEKMPMLINLRISWLTCNNKEFDKSKEICDKVSQKGFHSCKQQFNPNYQKIVQTRKSQKTFDFPPPCSGNMKNDIGKIFLRFVKKHLLPSNRYRKLFYKNNLKLSNCCMGNISTAIKKQSLILLSNKAIELERYTCYKG